MKVYKDESKANSLDVAGNTIVVDRQQSRAFHDGINKAEEYSWFYIVSLHADKGEDITMYVNTTKEQKLPRSNSLVYWTQDGWTWNRINCPVYTDSTGLPQRYTFKAPAQGKIFVSNTIFLDYNLLTHNIKKVTDAHHDLCTSQVIGNSLQGKPLSVITFNKRAQNPRGRILVTTGCHPAEPDVLASLEILKFLSSSQAEQLLQNYIIDIMPIQNPDGFINKSCLTANGINLYWNFRKDDRHNCPEAYYLWQYIQTYPPVLYIDFHAYVHQYHRPPMPYIKPLATYIGSKTKGLVHKLDRFLINHANRYYKFGKLAMWPHALSYYITKEYNTIAYTKYHLNLYEGVTRSQQRAREIFQGTTNILQQHHIREQDILLPPHGQAKPDYSDTAPAHSLLKITDLARQTHIHTKAYARYYKHRNHNTLFQ